MPAPATAREEREAKLLPAPDFELSGLADAIDGATMRALDGQDLVATYLDTPALTLARSGITIRHRTWDGPPTWTLKLPTGLDGAALVRRELTMEGPRNRRPREVSATVAAHLRGRRLVVVAELHTIRSRVAFVDGDGAPIVEVVLDLVTASRGRDPLGSWEEIEVEAQDHPEAGDGLAQVVRALHRMGCGALPPTPKLVRALGRDADQPPEVVVPALGAEPTVAEVLHRALARSVAQILTHDPLVRAGGDPEDLHQLRVALRRLRSDLHTFADLLDERASSWRDELGWVAGETNELRDLDVLRTWLGERGQSLPADDAPAIGGLVARADEAAERSRARVLRVLGSSRYLDLVHDLVGLAGDPPRQRTKVQRRALHRLEAAAADRWRKLERRMDRLGPDPTVADLHRARIAAKRCRAAVEAVRPLHGKRARRLARSLAGLQDVLGAVHDASVTEAWLRGVDDPALAFAAGELAVLARADGAASAARWPEAWAEVRRRHRS